MPLTFRVLAWLIDVGRIVLMVALCYALALLVAVGAIETWRAARVWTCVEYGTVPALECLNRARR